MNPNPLDRRQVKLRGEVVELRFMARAAEFGLRVIKPWGDSSRYDCVVEAGARFLRIQVKSTTFRHENHYTRALVRSHRQRYTSEEIDFFAVYVFPIDVWYIIPIKAVEHLRSGGISLTPHNSLSKMAPYREAWHLLGAEEAKAQSAGG